MEEEYERWAIDELDFFLKKESELGKFGFEDGKGIWIDGFFYSVESQMYKQLFRKVRIDGTLERIMYNGKTKSEHYTAINEQIEQDSGVSTLRMLLLIGGFLALLSIAIVGLSLPFIGLFR